MIQTDLLWHYVNPLESCLLFSSSDLYSEIGPLTRASRTDFEELQRTLKRMEMECKNAWDYLKIINKYDNTGATPQQDQSEQVSVNYKRSASDSFGDCNNLKFWVLIARRVLNHESRCFGSKTIQM